jgi:hypothetical protein
MIFLELVLIVVGVLAALAIILYSTWLLVHRLKSGESKSQSFLEWCRNIFEAIWGL